MNPSSAASPPFASSPSSHANTTKQAMISASVTYGVRRVGLASRRGIMAPRLGLLGLRCRLRGFRGLARSRRLAGARGRRGVRDGHQDRLVDAIATHPDERGWLTLGARDDVHPAEVRPVLLAT